MKVACWELNYWEYAAGGTKLGVWDEFLLGGQQYEDILMMLGRLRFEENFLSSFWGRVA